LTIESSKKLPDELDGKLLEELLELGDELLVNFCLFLGFANSSERGLVGLPFLEETILGTFVSEETLRLLIPVFLILSITSSANGLLFVSSLGLLEELLLEPGRLNSVEWKSMDEAVDALIIELLKIALKFDTELPKKPLEELLLEFDDELLAKICLSLGSANSSEVEVRKPPDL
jgi:hypothetical protein